ncbi:inositol monophosphatase family protein [Streptomyces sp. NPDC058459]|uniref:inositol monophosphatase family protein n=1 Tax=Streptomyces sp. NPDC058459 TaxID=3346508 RepID=UPI00365D8F03
MRADGALDVEALLALALDAAQRAGRAISDRRGRPGRTEDKSSPTDPVTQADRESDALIRELLERRRPQDGLLSEEGPAHGRPSRSGLRWVVDALDGTVNYLYGIPQFAVSVAVEDEASGWGALVGVVHDPLRDESFTAIRDHGAWLNGRPLRIHDPVRLPKALVATEFSYRSASRRRQSAVVGRVLASARDIRSTGSSALDLCWTAAGRFDAFYEDELGRWDWAAGRLIVAEAHGVVTPLGSGVVAAGPALHRELAPLLLSSGPP